MEKFDIIVVGAGSGGLNVALAMNFFGFRVLLVDKTDRDIGGDCLNFGCVPSKSFIHASKLVHRARQARNLGVSVSGSADLSKVSSYVSSKVELIRKHENASYFAKQGVTVVLGEAKFVSKNAVEVKNEVYAAKKIVIATGSRPKHLAIPGADMVRHLYTNKTIFGVKKLPKKLVVIGGGPIGVELGQAFARLGSKVTILEHGKRFLPKESDEITHVLREQLEAEGVTVHLNCVPVKFDTPNMVVVRKGREKLKLKFDAVLASIGRELNIPSGLEKAGVELTADRKGIKVDKYLKTTNKQVFLCGDIAGGYQFTHAAELHAALILRNFFVPFFKKKLSYDHFSWVTFTDPQIATFGLSEVELEKRRIKYTKVVEDYALQDRGITDSASGKLVLFINKKQILGGSLIAPNAGEIIQELVLANMTNLPLKSFLNKIYPYPVASRINRSAIKNHFKGSLTPFVKRVLKFLY